MPARLVFARAVQINTPGNSLSVAVAPMPLCFAASARLAGFAFQEIRNRICEAGRARAVFGPDPVIRAAKSGRPDLRIAARWLAA